MKSSGYDKVIIQLWLVISILFCSGCMIFYPYGGHISLAVNVLICFPLISISTTRFFSVVGAWIIIVGYFYLPREYGPPNATILLMIFSFLIGVSFWKEILIKNRLVVIRVLLGILCLSLGQYFLSFIGVPFPTESITLGPQEFEFHRPFYVERINISKATEETFLLGQRFHGPFPEPGALGWACIFVLLLSRNREERAVAIVLGISTMSMFFYIILSGWFVILKSRGYRSLIAVFLIILVLVFAQKSEIFIGNFFYDSTVGRVFGFGDKVFNTRLAINELEQIALFKNVFNSPGTEALFGVGFQLPGSGGSYRQWLLSTGIVFNLFLAGLFGFLIYRHLLFRVTLRSALFLSGLSVTFFYSRGVWLDLSLLQIIIASHVLPAKFKTLNRR